MDIRFLLALWTGKLALTTLRLTGSGGGALPGLLSNSIDPQILMKLSARGPKSLSLISGTNGKTTTSRMLAQCFDSTRLIHNRSGSNLIRGHIVAYLEKTNWLGKSSADNALLEVDEAVLPHLLTQVHPSLILLHNLFRDQLDRYGEIDAIVQKWKLALQKSLAADTLLLINADDPNLAYMAKNLSHSAIKYYGIDDSEVGTPTPTTPVDSYLSPFDGAPLQYSTYYVSHLGSYKGRPDLHYSATNILLSKTVSGSEFTLVGPQVSQKIHLRLPGLYNLYNGLAASILARECHISFPKIVKAFREYTSVFGRFEEITIDNHTLVFCLIKNPAGAAEVLRTINLDKDRFTMAFCMHDNFADGLDVSWYWDTPYELTSTQPISVLCAGKRASDIRLRLKYADYTMPVTSCLHIQEVIPRVLSQPVLKTYILSTYTASLELQEILRKRGVKNSYWKE